MYIQFDTYNVLNRIEEAANLEALGLTVPHDFANANMIVNPLGESPARGWFLLALQDVNALDLDGFHTVTFGDGIGGTVTVPNLCIVAVRVLTPGAPDDGTASCLVEVADSRWLCENPNYCVPLNKHYNISAPGYGPAFYYDDSMAPAGTLGSLNTIIGVPGDPPADPPVDGFVPWSWDAMVGDIWGMMEGQLGTYPGLPFEPDGQPSGWSFPGTSAWAALNRIMRRLGCAISCDLASTGNYSIVQVGIPDDAMDALTLSATTSGRLIYDGQFIEPTRSRIPSGARVYFHRQEEFYGTEKTTPKDSTQWMTGAVHFLDVAGSQTGSQPGVFHPIWDDLPATYDANGTLTNSNFLVSRAVERSQTYFRVTFDGGSRMHKTFSGTFGFNPGGTIKGVAWRQDDLGGLTTEIVRFPGEREASAAMMIENEGGDDGSTDDRPPFFGPSLPNYPIHMQEIQVTGPALDGLFPGKVLNYDPVLDQFSGTELCRVRSANQSALVENFIYKGRLNGFAGLFPIYTVAAGDVGYTQVEVEDEPLPPEPIIDFVAATGSHITITGVDDPDNTRSKVIFDFDSTPTDPIIGVPWNPWYPGFPPPYPPGFPGPWNPGMPPPELHGGGPLPWEPVLHGGPPGDDGPIPGQPVLHGGGPWPIVLNPPGIPIIINGPIIINPPPGGGQPILFPAQLALHFWAGPPHLGDAPAPPAWRPIGPEDVSLGVLGDLITNDGANNFITLSVGADFQYVTADSATDTGLRYRTMISQGTIAARPAVARTNYQTLYWSTDQGMLYASFFGGGWVNIGLPVPMTTAGDMIYMNGALEPDRISPNVTTDLMLLTQKGSGAVADPPLWKLPSAALGTTTVTVVTNVCPVYAAAAPATVNGNPLGVASATPADIFFAAAQAAYNLIRGTF